MSLKESESMEPLRTAQVETTSASTSTAPISVSTSWASVPTRTSGGSQPRSIFSFSSSSTIDILDHRSDPVSGGAYSVHLHEAARTNEPQSTTPLLPPPRGTAQELFLTMATDLQEAVQAAGTNEPQSTTPLLPPPRGTAQELFLTMATDPGGWFGVLIFRCFLVFPVDSR